MEPMTTEDLATSVGRLLQNTELRSIGRTLDMGEFHFTGHAGEVFPNSSADTEAWRIFRGSGPHYGYPEHLI
jgi:hypothetical protein